MSTFTSVYQVDLDPEWIDHLLVTAFDGSYGGAWYWINEDDAIQVVRILDVDDQDTQRDDAPGRWFAVDLLIGPNPDPAPLAVTQRGRAMVNGQLVQVHRVDKAQLDRAWAQIVNQRPIRSDLCDQFLRSMVENDLDVDAEAADCLVQIALYGAVLFS